jgi:photosystem II stability/assembly factor-like uncharacterized protein
MTCLQHVWTFIGIFALQIVALSASAPAAGEDVGPFANLALRPIGPALTSGRISDFAFHPQRKHEFYVATASGNLWRTTNNAITWQPLFEREGAYAIGVVELDPNDPLTVWVGTGENNSQRSVANGDGVYKSTNGGKTWTNMGLRNSGHISQIWIHPEDSDVVLVAAQGPLWNDGGDRGLYRTADGGLTWTSILQVDAHTGVNEFVVDPRDPDRIIASTYQRRRHVWVLINGGPGSAIYRTTDGGGSWTRLENVQAKHYTKPEGHPGYKLPKDHMGRIGLAMAPSDPDTIYAIIEANAEEQGVYRSRDFGETWEKRSEYVARSPQYYHELVVDPVNRDRVYSMDTFSQVSEDGGKTWVPLGIEHRHVDDHALWIDPDNTDHLYIGGDGGVYETWDRGRTWRHVRNLPITQFYRIQPDQDLPFYNVCGGTQDNNTFCAPSRTTVVHGIANSDWYRVVGGDGYKPQIDPTDPNIIYGQYQYGGLVRYDRRTQERVFLVPHPASGVDRDKWNWNTPLLISPHDPRRLYYASERLYRSDDRGDNWRAVSPDLTRQLDRNEFEVMGRVWSVDTIAKNDSTSMYGSIIGLSESPLLEGLIYVGTDDGLISVTEDGGATWRTVDSIRGVPDMAYVEDLIASVHDPDVAYAVIDNHKRGDFRPFVVRTADRGRSWRLISGDLPARGSAHTIAEDHVDPQLLFVGTEYGLFFSQDGGRGWTQLTRNFPVISVRDIEIQRRENDLVVGTFGRGIYILDDYTPLRTAAASLGEREATLFPVRDAWLYVESDLWGGREKGSMGAQFFMAPNPPFGAVFTYHLADEIRTARKSRRKAEIEVEKQGGDTPYPSWGAIRDEDREEDPQILLIVRDSSGAEVRRVAGEVKKGLHRVAWDLRYPAPDAIDLLTEVERAPWESPPQGPLVVPGDYSVTLAKRQDGELSELGEPQRFSVIPIEASPEVTDDRPALLAFQQKAAELQRAVLGAVRATGELQIRIDHLKEALRNTPRADESYERRLRQLEARLDESLVLLTGDESVASRNEPTPWPVSTRIERLYANHLGSQSPVPDFYEESYAVAAAEFAGVLAGLRSLDTDLGELETELDRLGAPWTPGRVPDWQSR